MWPSNFQETVLFKQRANTCILPFMLCRSNQGAPDTSSPGGKKITQPNTEIQKQLGERKGLAQDDLTSAWKERKLQLYLPGGNGVPI